MVLQPGGCGRVSHRRHQTTKQKNKVRTERGKDTDFYGVFAPLFRDPIIFYNEAYEDSCTGGNRSRSDQ